MTSEEIKVLKAELASAKENAESYKKAGQEVYCDLIKVGAITYQLMDLIGINEIMAYPEDKRKGKIFSTIMKKASKLMVDSDYSDKFSFLSEIVPINEKYEGPIQEYLKNIQKTKEINE